MLWLILAVLIPAVVLSAFFTLKALNEIEKGSDPFKVLVLGSLAGDEHFTPAGRRYRLWSLGYLGGGVLVAILIYLIGSIR
jgi:hypothetical protein